MTVKQYLSQLELFDKRIQNKLAEEKQLRSLATSISSHMDSERIKASCNNDRIGDIVSKIVDVETELNALIKEYLDQRSEIIQTIEEITRVKPYEVVFKKFVEYKSLEEISKEMYCSVSYVKRLLTEGMEIIRKIKKFEK